MPKFRRIPVVIDAEQWGAFAEIEGVARIRCQSDPTGELGTIRTLEGVMTARPGDWIITGIQGEKYPCKPEIFHKTYEPVAEEKPICLHMNVVHDLMHLVHVCADCKEEVEP